MIDLSITKDPEWRKQREQQWLNLEKDYKEDYTEKEVEVFRRYFFDGEVTVHGNAYVTDSASIYLIPIRTPEAWEYALQHVIEKESSTLLSGLFVMLCQDSYGKAGWSYEEQCEFFDWLLGKSFTPELKSKVPVGRNKVWLTHKLDPDWVFWQAIHVIYGWLSVGGEVDLVNDHITVWAAKLDYLLSIFPLLDKRFFELTLYPPREEIKPYIKPYHVQFRLQKVLGWMKDYERGGKKKGYIKEREQFLPHFKTSLEVLEPKPEGLEELLDKFVR